MLTVKCITMQRDETQLLDPWLRYHGYLFGFENLIVIDNGSILPETLATLSRYERVGVTIYRQFSTPGQYMRKGPITADAIRILDHQAEYDLAIPLDCDEFVALWKLDRLTCNRSLIIDYLSSLDLAATHFRISNSIYNVPGRPGWMWPTQGALKGFMRSRSVEYLDHGYHTFSERDPFPMQATDITHLHFHHKPFATLKEHTRWKLEGFVDVNDEKALRSFEGPGKHLVRNLLSTKAEYHRQFDDHITFFFPEFSEITTALGIENEMMSIKNPPEPIGGEIVIRLPREPASGKATGPTLTFTPLAYRKANFDLAAAGVNPLQHFLFDGYREGRSLE